MKEWTVAGGIVLDGDAVLLVQNQRRNGSLDWSTPGGVIEVHDGETLLDGLTREVEEETGLRVTSWVGPLYEVRAQAPDLGWDLRAEVHLAIEYDGDVHVDDPDGIVVDAGFVPLALAHDRLAGCHPWVREPLIAWLLERWAVSEVADEVRLFGYRVDGADAGSISVTRL